MTLAVIFLNVWFTLSLVATPSQASPQSAQSSKPADTASTQDQGNAQQQNPTEQSQPSASKPAQTSSSTPSPHKGSRPSHKRKVQPSNCAPAPAATSAPAGSDPSTKAPADPSAGASTTAPPPAAPPTNCPPPKVIVRQGSTAEPSIQLVGGDATSHERDAANQMLAVTDANLKKIEGTQLSSSQQDMVTQIRQFMDQSKKATADGDTEQARTLAWKAKTLSEELAGPPK